MTIINDHNARDEKFTSEHTRQTKAFSAAIEIAIQHAGRQFECPLINSVAAAIVMAEAKLLASVPAECRSLLLEAMNNFRPEAYAICAPNMKTEVIVSHGNEALQ